jgi:hypothetical protein
VDPVALREFEEMTPPDDLLAQWPPLNQFQYNVSMVLCFLKNVLL